MIEIKTLDFDWLNGLTPEDIRYMNTNLEMSNKTINSIRELVSNDETVWKQFKDAYIKYIEWFSSMSVLDLFIDDKCDIDWCGMSKLRSYWVAIDNYILIYWNDIASSDFIVEYKNKLHSFLDNFSSRLKTKLQEFMYIEWFDQNVINWIDWKISDTIKHIIDSNSIPNKQKFMYIVECMNILEDVNNVDKEKIDWLRSIRESMSLWVESWQPDWFYLNMILTNSLVLKFVIWKEMLKTVYEDEKLDLYGKSYHKESHKNMMDWNDELWTVWVRWLDKKYWLNFVGKMKEAYILRTLDVWWWMNWWLWVMSMKLIWTIIQSIEKTDPEFVSEAQLSSELLSHLHQGRQWDILLTLKNWRQVFAKDLYDEYMDLMGWYSKNQVWVLRKWERIISKAEDYTNLFGKDWYDMDYQELWKNLGKWFEINKNMNPADFVIILKLMSSLIPVLWDITWWIDDFNMSYIGVDQDGNLLWSWERWFMMFCSFLWISMVWWAWYKVLKSAKLIKKFKEFWEIVATMKNNKEFQKLLDNNPKIAGLIQDFEEWLNFVTRWKSSLRKLQKDNYRRLAEVNTNWFYNDFIAVWDKIMVDVKNINALNRMEYYFNQYVNMYIEA